MSNYAVMLLFSSRLSPRHELLLKSLKEWGWRISVIAWDRKGDTPIPTEYSGLIDHWQWVRVPAPTWSTKLIVKLPLYYYHVWRIISKLNKDKPALWFLTHFFQLPIALFLHGSKLYDAAEMYALVLSFYFGPLQRLVRPLLGLLEGLLVTRVNGILTVDSKGGWLEGFYRRWNPHVQVIWNVPSKLDDPEPYKIEALKNGYSEHRVVAFVGGQDKSITLFQANFYGFIVSKTNYNLLSKI